MTSGCASVLCHDWQVLRLQACGTVVGLLESYPYEQEKLGILPGDLLVIFN
jgi:serine phosphatase RsbU (regulator of sigma subunit)